MTTGKKEGRKLKCKCGYEWVTYSLSKFVTCPNCQLKTRGISNESKTKTRR